MDSASPPASTAHTDRSACAPFPNHYPQPTGKRAQTYAKVEKVGLQSLSLRQHFFANNSPLLRAAQLSRCFRSSFDFENRTADAGGGRLSLSPGRFSPKLWTSPRKYGIFSVSRSSAWRSHSAAELEVSLAYQHTFCRRFGRHPSPCCRAKDHVPTCSTTSISTWHWKCAEDPIATSDGDKADFHPRHAPPGLPVRPGF